MLTASKALQPGAMPRPPSDTVQITVRVPTAWLADADEVARLLSTPGFEASRTDAFRAAIARGLAALRAEKTPEPPPAPKSEPRVSKPRTKKR